MAKMRNKEDKGKQLPMWKNKYGCKVVMGCLSCQKVSGESGDGIIKKKICGVDGKKHNRYFCCSEWKPTPVMEAVMGPVNIGGGKAVPGKVKQGEYLQWVIDHIDTLPADPREKRAMYLRGHPGKKIFYGRE